MSKESNANKQIARAAGTVMLAFAFGQIVGLLRRILVAQAFGAGAELDAFIAANRVSETLFNLVAGGALGSAFIPTFTGLLAKDENKSAWRLASAIANWVALVLSLLAALAAIFAPQIVRHALAPGFSANPEQFVLTVTLLRIQLASAFLFGLSGLVMGILNSHQVFLIPALTPSMYQLGMIFGVFVLAPQMGIRGLAWGVVIGALFHLVLQIPALLRLNRQDAKNTEKKITPYILTLGFGDSNVFEVLRLMGPRLLGVAVVQLNFWVNTWLASKMPAGSVVGIEFGFALMLMAQVAIAQSIATAAMPTFSAQYALGKLDEVRNSLAATIRGVLLLSIPAAVGLIILRVPLITLLYQRGEFDAHSTELVAWALLWYAVGLVGHSVMEILARAFYALHDTKTPVLVGIGAMSLNVFFSIAFAALFRQIGWMPHGGLALANSLATALETVLLMILMRKRLSGIDGKNIARGFGQASFAALGMGIALIWWMQTQITSATWMIVLGGLVIGGIVYLLGVWVLKVPEMRAGISFLRRKLGK
ncbi:MAG: murein biosynthesis integral membrane protein MurJ [Anaerolineae bacterium]|nr:murein biosynthesis integral membrane protein MurJ [Anaerolineae bacterium]MBT3714296.1 murein biosynthesis integral membrane protein MurJ [Anaerolineae bacterium]MBT4309432.1 murein biosynthesis integral membrane protein MurJ [Anaerolineae bacterium]MBT4458294.1 murein biosynthesis integral membrane protein MurJ [Anaerolineae bacterium]MBT6061821.1 murein biosynthesis integral membrane protein MurJ [Anaerolineae bacterium]